MRPLNILIGANGVGKSNFISFFKFLNRLYEQQIQLYVSLNGKADSFLYFGKKVSDFLGGEIVFDNEWQNGYRFQMEPDQADNLIIARERSQLKSPGFDSPQSITINRGGSPESVLKDSLLSRDFYLKGHFKSFKVFHFHDTSSNSKVKGFCGATDYTYLQEDGGNLAAFLYRLQEAHPPHFKIIERTVRSIAPFFDRFHLKPDEINGQQIQLRWLEKGSEQLFTAHNFSDGTLRMICLATLLMQPEPPDTIIIDEPELGLHPFAIEKLAAMLNSASAKSQVIVSTQSVNLLNYFDAEDVIVVEREDGQSVFHRLDPDELEAWLSEYSLSELWEKNVLGGRP